MWKLFPVLAIFLVTANSKKHVQTTYGPIFTNDPGTDGVVAFKGVPYAAPPVGDLRWQAPFPPKPWTKPLNTTDYGYGCISFSADDMGYAADPPRGSSEDCLNVNIWIPTECSSEPLPVMVWVHGGGFIFGTGTAPECEATRMAKHGVVVVTIDYRLGNLGFMARTDLDAENPSFKSGTQGLQDIMLSLKWVKSNIAAFGGDSGNVVLFGESAGAHAIGMLMASPLAAGLFDKAITQSGARWDSEHGDLATFEEARQKGQQFGEIFGSNTTLADLRALPTETLYNNAAFVGYRDPFFSYTPSRDYYVFPQLPSTVFLSGKEARIPLLSGFMADEGYSFQLRGLADANLTEYERALLHFFETPGRNNNETERLAKKLYPAQNVSQAIASSRAWAGDFVIAEQTWENVDLHSRFVEIPSYLYQNSYTSTWNPDAGHGSDIGFTFGNLLNTSRVVGSPGPDDREFSESIIQYWTNFAKTGNPNKPVGGLPEWPRYYANSALAASASHDAYSEKGIRLIMDLGQNITVNRSFDYSRYEFIRSYRDAIGSLPRAWRTFNNTPPVPNL